MINYKKKKVVIFTDAWYPQVNGVVRCIEETRKVLEKNGFDVTVIHPGYFYSVPLLFYTEIRLSLFCRAKIMRILKTKKPDYIHIFTEGSIGLNARFLCLKNKLKFTTSYHTNFQYYVPYYTYMKVAFFLEYVYLLFRRLYNSGKYEGVNAGYVYLSWFHNASNGTMVTENLAKDLQKNGFSHLVFWPLGVDVELFKRNENPKLKELYKFKSPVFVYFGRLAREKNVEEYLRCNLPGTKLIIGGGPLESSLRKKYGGSAIFLGYKKGKELIDLLSISDVFVFPSRTETFGLVVLEALACGIPVAAHKAMGPKDIITHGVDGFLGEDLREAALSCLNLSREKCRQKALQFSWDEAGKVFIKNLVEV